MSRGDTPHQNGKQIGKVWKAVQKTFEKPLDKQYQICYNNYRKKEKRGNKYGCFNEIRVWFEVYWFGF